VIGSTSQRIPTVSAILCIAIIVTALAVVGTALAPGEALLIFWLLLGGLVGFTFYAIEGDLLIAICAWLGTLMVFHEEFWRMTMPFFFSITIPRLGLVVLALLYVAMVALGRIKLRSSWPVSRIILAVAAYFFLSALVSGFQTRSIVSVHYRLIGGYLFPFAAFALILHAFWGERDLRRLAYFFAIVSIYLTFIGWCEQFKLHALVWPRFINDPGVGIHWGRVRGPFVSSAAMGLAFVYCYFNNLVLARSAVGFRWILYAINAAMLPAIFWTKTRSVWLAFVLCSLIWAVYSRRRMSRIVSVSLLLALTLLVSVLNMGNFLSADRSRGGLTDTGPILLRVGLAQMTWEIVKAHPLFGLGFGHFRDYAPSFARDPSSPYYAFGTTALEHNNLLSIAAETGLIGLILYFRLVVALIFSSVRLYRKIPAGATGLISRDAIVLYWILAAAYFIDGTFRETSDNPFANCLFFGLSAVPVALDYLLSPVPLRAISRSSSMASSVIRRRCADTLKGRSIGATHQLRVDSV
jgi:O-antigen ligase